MTRRQWGVPGLLLVGYLMIPLTAPAAAQASEFGIRGLGLPGRQLSASALGGGGASGLFDGMSALNPAAVATLNTITALFTSNGEWRQTTNPAGSAATRATRFPEILVGGPIPHSPLGLAVSYSLFTDRDFTVVDDNTASPRGVPIVVHDTLSSRGGIDDLRLAGSWTFNSRLVVGAGFHFLTGSNRLRSRRQWEDSLYQSPEDLAELSYAGTSLSAGVIWRARPTLELAATFRRNNEVTVRRDSNGTGQLSLRTHVVGRVPLPTRLGAALRFTPNPHLTLSASIQRSNWSVADSSLKADGAPGADNTMEINAGMVLVRNLRHPSTFPLRLGVRRATLPFTLASAPQPTEFGVSIGTGRRFAADRGGFDLAIEHVWRRAGPAYHESAFLVTLGISVRPGGLTP